MKFVQPYDKVTLLLDRSYMPFQIATAKAIFYHLLKGHGKGIDAAGRHFEFDDVINKRLTFFPDQPCMRSASEVWPIPTVFITNSSFFFKSRKAKSGLAVTLKDLHKHYKGICQICLRPKRISEFSKDHVLPRSKGGSDHDFNLVLACKSCNSRKGSEYPYKNVLGQVLKGAHIYSTGFFRPEENETREEWKPFLFLH